MEPAMFSVANLFDPSSSEDEDEEEAFLIRDHEFPGMVLHIREFSFHQVNANLLWPGAVLFADWIVEHEKLFRGRRILELGSGTGALAVFLKKAYDLDITTSDYDDPEIEKNIRFNCELNDLACLPHIRHTWGEKFPEENSTWDLIIASDILLYVKQYPNLIKSLSFLFRKFKPAQVLEPISLSSSEVNLESERRADGSLIASDISEGSNASDSSQLSDLLKLNVETIKVDETQKMRKDFVFPSPCFVMSWRRRIPKEDEAEFFEGCNGVGFAVDDLGSRVYCIYPK
ncbi:hypothetical protein R1flu_019538 [Riccia fluitans]|uniref:Uncharacterized protein n=1 Tax=Riccia fluitans TaxID=41844 RepID=A0ABD1ZKE6_9MARC